MAKKRFLSKLDRGEIFGFGGPRHPLTKQEDSSIEKPKQIDQKPLEEAVKEPKQIDLKLSEKVVEPKEKKTEQSSVLKETVEKKLENGSGKDFKLKK